MNAILHTKAKDSVTIYSNGQAHIKTYRTVKPGVDQEFSLPFKATSMEDVLASFGVFGDVEYTKPASFLQSNKKSSLQLEGTTFDTLVNFRGANIKFAYGAQRITGVLFGTDVSTQTTSDGNSFENRFITVVTSTGIETIPWHSITSLEFTDPDIKSEIEKALAASRQKLKPDAVFLNVGLRTIAESYESVRFQWVEQLNPWSLSYRLNKSDTGYKLDAVSIVHNTTDVDWNNTIFTFVTGKPLTFISDLDKQRTITRTQVNIQDTVARGGYIAEDGIPTSMETYSDSCESKQSFAKSVTRRAPTAGAGFESISTAQSVSANYTPVSVEEVGDFCIYKQDCEMSIPANTTAAVPLFSRDIKDAKTVLAYDPKKNFTRPFRVIQFTNDTNETLGTGVCVVFEKGVFQGKCILNASKAGEKRMLYYAEETGVSVKKASHRNADNYECLNIAKGVLTTRMWQTNTTTYILLNVKAEEFTVLLDYDKVVNSSSECTCSIDGKNILPTEELANGIRYSAKLPAKSTVTVTVVEKYLNSQTFSITNNINWFLETYVLGNNAFASDENIKVVIAAKNAVNDKNAEIEDHKNVIDKANKLKENMTQVLSLGTNAGNLAEYQSELKSALATIKESNQSIEKLNGELANLQKKLYTAIGNLTSKWNGDQIAKK